MKKNHIISVLPVAILFIFFNTASAQTRFTKSIATKVTLSGKVTAANTGLPLQDATIYIPDLKAGTSTDVNGNYILHNIPAGFYLVQAGFVGYKNNIKTLSFSGNTTVDFAMEISVIEENEIIVTGTSKATTIKRNPI